MARWLRCKAGNEWIEGSVKPLPSNSITLTPGQAVFLLAVMQDYIDVTHDKGVYQRARQIRTKLDKMMTRPTESRARDE